MSLYSSFIFGELKITATMNVLIAKKWIVSPGISFFPGSSHLFSEAPVSQAFSLFNYTRKETEKGHHGPLHKLSIFILLLLTSLNNLEQMMAPFLKIFLSYQ